MTNYRRLREPGGIYFFTVITFNRQPILTEPLSRTLLRKSWKNVQAKYPFETLAVCLLPDHLHTIWRLPEGDTNYSLRWNEIKRHFTREYVNRGGESGVRNDSRIKRREQAVWQRRFWEHTFYEQDDLNTHIDYIHFNPKKHGLVNRVSDWPWSSFHRFARMGIYPADWGGEVGTALLEMSMGE